MAGRPRTRSAVPWPRRSRVRSAGRQGYAGACVDATEPAGQDAVSVDIESRLASSAGERLQFLLGGCASDVSPAIDHVQHAVRRPGCGFAERNRAGERPCRRRSRGEARAGPRIVQRARLDAETRTAASAVLAREAQPSRTPGRSTRHRSAARADPRARDAPLARIRTVRTPRPRHPSRSPRPIRWRPSRRPRVAQPDHARVAGRTQATVFERREFLISRDSSSSAPNHTGLEPLDVAQARG